MKKNVQRLMMLAVTVMASMATFAQSGETTTLKPLTEPLGDYYMTRYHVTNANSSPGQIEQIGFASNVNSNAEQMTKASGDIYNMQGIRVNKAQKGLYIINGKKVMVK